MFRIHKKHLLLPFLLLLVVSCSQDNLDPDSILGPEQSGKGELEAIEKGSAGETGYCDRVFHNRIEEYLENDQDVLFMMFQETIDWSTGGILDATPASWPPGYEIKMVIPEECVSTSFPGYESVLFGISVPAAGLNSTVTSVPFYFYPDGIEFQNKPELILSWPPWAGTPSSQVISLITIQTEIHEGEVHYRLPEAIATKPDSLLGGAAMPLDGWTPTDLSTGIGFHLPHFSRWEMVDGDESDDGGPTTDEYPSAADSSQSCWTEFEPDEPDPFEPIAIIR